MFTVKQYHHLQSLHRAERMRDTASVVVATIVYLSCGAMAGALLGIIIEVFGG